jgi:hypothetical protein
VFSPLSHHTIRFKRYSGRLLVLTSIVLHAFTVYFFTRQPDRFAAFTVLPLWFWGLLGLSIAGTALILLRSPFSMIVCTIWIVTVLFGADEAKVVANIGKKPATKTPLSTLDGRPVIRVLTLNCENSNKGSPIEDILAWNPDIILVQEIYPYFVKTICDRAFAGTGHYRVHKSSGIISRWPISRDGRIDQFRDHQVTVSLPDGSNLEVVNVHLASAATDMRIWRSECWNTHRYNRVARRFELGSILQTVETTANPVQHAVIIGGDFNAPAQDTTYRLMHRDFRDAFLTAGTGWGDTFPSKVPLMRLDHVYSSRHLRAVKTAVETVAHSDHRILVVDLVRILD